MYSPVVGDLLRIDAFCQCGNQVSVNTFWYDVSAVTLAGLPVDKIAQEWGDDVGPSYQAIMGGNAFFKAVKVSVPKQLPQPAPGIKPFNLQGTDGVDCLPRAVCGLIKFTTDLSGGRHRGRVYAPFIREDFNDANGEPTPACLVALNALGLDVVGFNLVDPDDAGNTITIGQVIYSRKFNETTPVSAHQAEDKWGTQHRRGDFGKANSLPI